MSQNQTECQAIRIDAFLNQQLSSAEVASFERHLDECEHCRIQLTAAAAEGSWWTETSEFLLEPESLSDPLAEALSFLNPTDDPRMLGRFGRYEIAGLIGQGGMGLVLKGFDQSLNRYAAIKVLAPQLATRGSARNRFAREAQAAAAVVHDNVIAIHGVSESAGLPYLVMPYIDGESLHVRLEREGPMSPTEIIRVAHQVASGLAAAHKQGLVHRDIKPANILLPQGVERVLITDFGLARAVDDSNLTGTGTIAGTPQFMSPEQARGEAVDFRSDLFSLGSVMYAMCTGRNPFRASNSFGILKRIIDDQPRNIREINPAIPTWLARIVQRLHAKNPDDRYQSAAELAELLEQCLAHLQHASQPLPIELSSDNSSTQRAVSFGMAACLVLLAGLAWFLSPYATQSTPQSNTTNQIASLGLESKAPKTSAIIASDRQTVAIVNGEEITQQQIANICLDRYGTETLDAVINKRLVLTECQKAGVIVSETDIQNHIEEKANSFGMSSTRFVDTVCSKRSMTSQYFKRDVVWPQLAIERLFVKGISEISEGSNDGTSNENAATLLARLKAEANIVNLMDDPKTRQENPGVAALVDDQPISIAELKETCLRRFGKSILEKEINRTLLNQALTKRGIEVRQADIEEEIERSAASMGIVAKQDLSIRDQWISLMQNNTPTGKTFPIEDQIWPSAALRRLAAASVTISTDDLRREFESQFGPRVNALSIVLSDSRSAQKVWDMASSLAGKPEQRADAFANLASQYSIDAITKNNAGKMAPIRRFAGEPAIQAVAFELKPDEISPIVQVNDKYVILYCIGHTQPTVIKFEAVEEELRQSVTEKKTRIAIAEQFQRLKDESEITNYWDDRTQETSEQDLQKDKTRSSQPTDLSEIRRRLSAAQAKGDFFDELECERILLEKSKETETDLKRLGELRKALSESSSSDAVTSKKITKEMATLTDRLAKRFSKLDQIRSYQRRVQILQNLLKRETELGAEKDQKLNFDNKAAMLRLESEYRSAEIGRLSPAARSLEIDAEVEYHTMSSELVDAEAKAKQSKKLFEKGFVTRQQMEQDQDKVKIAKLKLEKALMDYRTISSSASKDTHPTYRTGEGDFTPWQTAKEMSDADQLRLLDETISSYDRLLEKQKARLGPGDAVVKQVVSQLEHMRLQRKALLKKMKSKK